MIKKVKLGDEVECTVTGFKGIAVCRTQYLNGCDRLGVQPPIDKDGKHPEALHFDEMQLQVTKPGKYKPQPVWDDEGKPETVKRNVGGPTSNRII